MDVEVTLTGPLFDGRAARMLEAALDEGVLAVAERGAAEVRARVGRHARHPTGRFAGRVVVDRAQSDLLRVHPRGVRYGGWLEGTSRRNQLSTFKGYALFAATREDLRGRAHDIAGEPVARAVQEINR